VLFVFLLRFLLSSGIIKADKNKRVSFLESLDVARKVVEAAGEKLATDISLLDVRDVCTFASYFVICSGDSERQLNAIGEEIEQTLKKSGVRAIHVEGDPSSGWILYDYGDVIIHVFSPEERNFYQFDELWHKGKPVIRIQ